MGKKVKKNLKWTNKLIYIKTFDINVYFLQIKMKTFKIKLDTFLWNERDKHNFLSGQFDTNKFVSIKGYAYLLATSHPHKTLYAYFVLSYNIFYWIFSIHLEHANSSMPYSTLYTVDCQLLCSHELSMLWQYMKVYFRVE